MADTSKTRGHAPARIITNNDAYYLAPNEIIPADPRPEVARSEYGYEFLSFPLVRQTFRDKRFKPRDLEYFEKLGASEIILEFIREGNLNFMAPDKHDRIRQILSKAFTPSRIEQFRPQMRAIANELIDQFAEAESADLVSQFAHFFPIAVIAQFIGVPAKDVAAFNEATVQLRMLGQMPFAPGMPALEKALRFLYDYVEGLVSRRDQGPPQNDFLGALITMQVDGADISRDELVWSLVFLLLGGHDTTRYTLSGCIVSVIEAGLWDRLVAEPQMIPDVITESMRLHPGTPRQMRIVEADVEVAGVCLHKDDVVSLSLLGAGHDPAVFEEPEAFKCGRTNPGYDIGFGYGRHVCLGQALAKAEMAEAIHVITERLANVKIAGDFRFKPTGVIAGYDSIPITFRTRGR